MIVETKSELASADVLHVKEACEVLWDDQADVVVVGFGGAGAVAAIQAAELGAEVVALDRFDGGGATAYSGGVVYAGATRYQEEAGVKDSVEAMARYLALEVGNVVGQETVRRYCEQSAANLEWLTSLGVKFSSTLFNGKTTYPPDGKFLYYSGNEKVESSKAVSHPAPRGHRTQGDGFTGRFFFAALRKSAALKGVRLRKHSWVSRLIVDATGRVIGVEAVQIPEAHQHEHQKQYDRINPMVPFKEEKAERANAKAREIETMFGKRYLVQARKGVVLSSGGYVYNLQMLNKYAPLLGKNYKSIMRMGSLGDDGSGDRLGRAVGAETRMMDNMFIGRALSPPSAFIDGILVNQNGERFVNEAIYLGSLGRAVVEQPGGRAWLIVNRKTYHKAFYQILTGGWSIFKLFNGPTLLNMWLGGTRKAKNLSDIARKCQMDPSKFLATIEHYNAMAARGHDLDYAKLSDHLVKIEDGPCVALNLSVENKYSFLGVFSLGGLPVNETSGAVLRPDGSEVDGLYAAGRAAVGLPSNMYISGLSLGDCVFSGRRAARACVQDTAVQKVFSI